ncbi:hypothetical protein C1646_754740 [Rhizophagus diaphanus]|nr:hypothetical protein C1646_754740 [Rhizophagus diaphanus] [Rhizophagus sp. MUCL 43196]
MLYLLVHVNEGSKTVISEHVVSIESTNKRFYDLFNAITLGKYEDREVHIFIRREKSESWREVDNRLNGDLKMLEVLGFLQVKFCLIVDTNSDTSAPTQNQLNAFNILMKNAAQKVGWTGGLHDTIGTKFVNRLTDALWYIDPHLSTLRARSYYLPVLFTQLKTYQQCWAIGQFWTVLDSFGQVLDRDGEIYNKFYHTSHHRKNLLSHQKLDQLSNSLELSISQPWACDDLWSQVMPAVFSLIEILRKYSEYLVATNNSMNNLHHSDKSARSPKNNSVMYRISACGCNSLNENYIQLDNILFEKQFYEYIDIQPYLPNDVIKIPEIEAFDDEHETLKARMLARIHEELPHYFTRQMQKNYSYIKKVSPAILRMLYFDFTADPNIIFDLRTNNGFNGTKFNVFWNELEAYFNEQNLLSVDERHHETVLYMPLAISVRDLHEIIIERLSIIYNNTLPSDIYIPSEEWIRLQFCPTNATTTRSIYNTGRFNVKFKVQSRLLQKNSDDAHYYDKYKIPIGEDVAVSIGVRNRHSMVAQDSILAAADHNFTKLSLTPSVTFFISFPNDISGSFYDGQVFVSYKDTIFEPSSAIRHSAEFLNALNIQYEHQIFPPILCLYTDRGPDYRCTYGSVQIALICLFFRGNFDFLVAVRTAPNHSWTNPAERVMSTLNLGLQGVALKRDQMSSESKTLFDMVNTLDDIRKKAQEYSDLEFELKESIAATEKEIAELFESIFNIDSTLKIEETTQAQICHHPALVEFIKTYCRVRVYSFQIKKCNNPACLYCKPIRLPLNEFHNLSFLPDLIPSQDNTDHYATFQNVYGTETTEEYRPTYMQSQANAEPIPNDKSLTCKEQKDYQQAMNLYSYSCSASIFPDDHYLKEVVFVRTQIKREDLVTSSQSLKERFKQIYPLCEGCQENGKEFYTKGEIKTNGHAFKRRKHGFANNCCPMCNKQFPSIEIISGQCRRCYYDKNTVKKFSADNNMDSGDLPEELCDFTEIEKMLIARIFSIISVYYLCGGQYVYCSNIINFSQNMKEFALQLPQNPSSLDVLIVRHKSANSLIYKNFTVCYIKVAYALCWLKQNNRYYTDIVIDEKVLQSLPEDDTIGSNFVPVPLPSPNKEQAIGDTLNRVQDNDIPITWPNIDGTPINKFQTSNYIASVFPTLYPTGNGDLCSNYIRDVKLSEYFSHLLKYKDGRFAHHPHDKQYTIEEIKEMVEKDNHMADRIVRFGEALHGIRQFWTKRRYELADMIRQLGSQEMIFFTFNIVDLYWPELHNLMLFEWQHRGSPHIYGIRKRKDASSIDWKKMKEDEDMINNVVRYLDSLITTKNPDRDAPRHTKCNPAYYLHMDRTDKNICRFGYPKEITNDMYLRDNNEQPELIMAKNDEYVNPHNRLQLQGWRVNVNLKLILSMNTALQYISKYASKLEPRSAGFSEILNKIFNKNAPDALFLPVFQDLLLYTVAEHDISVQKTCHLLLSILLYHSSHQFVTLNLNKLIHQWLCRTGNNNEESFLADSEVGQTVQSPLQKYWVHPADLDDVSLFWFHQQYNFWKELYYHHREIIENDSVDILGPPVDNLKNESNDEDSDYEYEKFDDDEEQRPDWMILSEMRLDMILVDSFELSLREIDRNYDWVCDVRQRYTNIDLADSSNFIQNARNLYVKQNDNVTDHVVDPHTYNEK